MPQRLRAEGCERRHEEGERATHAERHVQCGAARGAVSLDEVPWSLLIEVLVPETGELNRLAERIPEVKELEVVPDAPPLLFDAPNHRLVRTIEEGPGRGFVPPNFSPQPNP